jgi:hypothetical protein
VSVTRADAGTRRAGVTTRAAMERLLTGDVDARPLAVLRVVIGVTAFARALVAYGILERLLRPTTIRLLYVSWLPQLGPSAIPWLVALWAAAALLFACGWWTRTAGVVLAAAILYVLLLDEQTYSNHLYLLVLIVLLLVLANAGAALGVDARGDTRPRAEAYAVWLLRTQVSATYAFAALAKLNSVYLSGATLAGYMSPTLLAALPEATRLPFVLACSWGTIAVELGLAVTLWSARWRRVAVAAGVALHVGMVALLPPGARVQLAIFAIEMVALYLVFFVPLASCGRVDDLAEG